jgi:hypothetical protein
VGICDGLTYDQVKVRFPEEYRSRMQDKLKYRYPRGESYLDVIARLEVRSLSVIFYTLTSLSETARHFRTGKARGTVTDSCPPSSAALFVCIFS